LGADYHELTLSKKDFFDFLPKMVYYQDEPIADPANIPIYYISKVAAAQGVKVLLGGEGSDELFVGYEHWQLAKQFATTFENRPIAAGLVSFLHKNGPFKNKRQYYLGLYEKILNSQPAFWSGSELRSESDKKKILSSGFLEKLGKYNSFQPISELYSDFKTFVGADVYDWMAVTDLQYRLPDLLLARLDRMMMAASVEGRNPFLDKNVIEYALRIPPELRTKNKESKYILKKAFEGILPDEILYRKKDSFTVPLSQLFQSEPYFSQSINAVEQFNSRENIFKQEYLDYLKTKASAIEFWNITNLAMWHNRVCDGVHEMESTG
jgi:asparagine synthase (glutamine-hydrolysing)